MAKTCSCNCHQGAGRFRDRLKLPLAIGLLVAVAAASGALAMHEVPQSASPIDVSLVPAFRQCGTQANAPNGRHRAPLSNPSCIPPKPTSSVAAVGHQATAFARLRAFSCPMCEAPINADIFITSQATDVRAGDPSGPDYDPNPNGADLTLVEKWRISDHANSSSQSICTTSCPGTVADLDFPVPVECAQTSAADVGSTCAVDTSANAVLPGAIQTSEQAVIQVFRLRLNDAGPDGVPGGGDDTLFQQQGLYLQ